ncbi:hypothetical protein GGS24DRAFT_478304 [Hypoxylon argillaceum]|nr:hypothetical protein GGS24DRAFT_478304 [Hypoxylon argillaceum]
MAAVPSLPVDTDSHGMSLGRRTSARQALRQLSTSKLNQSESQPSPSATTRENTKPQPQAQSESHVQQYSASHDSSDDEILMPMRLSAFTKALLNNGNPNLAPYVLYQASGQHPHRPSLRPGSAHGAAHPHQRIVAICEKMFRSPRLGETHGPTACSSRPQSQRHQPHPKIEVAARLLERESCVSVIHQGAEPCTTGCHAPCRRLRRGQERRARLDPSKESRISRHRLRWTNGSQSKSMSKQASRRQSHQCAQSGS